MHAPLASKRSKQQHGPVASARSARQTQPAEDGFAEGPGLPLFLKAEHERLQTYNAPDDAARAMAMSADQHGDADAQGIASVLRSPGSSLDAATLHLMQEHFRRDFGAVRVHVDVDASVSAEALGAVAYTAGPDLVFAQGQYAPHTPQGRTLLAHELTHVVQQGAAPRVAGSSSGLDLTVGKGSGAEANITPAASGIQRKNGGARRPARRPLPSRGPLGQREGQRLPRNSPARREAFERRERARIEAARQRFDATVARNQKWLENWAKEGSEPKTPAQRAFRLLVKMLEIWDDLGSSWDKTHYTLDAALQDRLDLGAAERDSGTEDKRLIAAWLQLEDFDAKMLRRLSEWQERMDKWEEWRDRVTPTATNVINLSLDLTVLLLDAVQIASDLHAELSRIDKDIQALRTTVHFRSSLQDPGPRQESIETE